MGPLREQAIVLILQHGEVAFDLALLRGDFSDAQIAGAVGQIWQTRTDRYSELRAALPPDTTPGEGQKRVEMSYIGG